MRSDDSNSKATPASSKIISSSILKDLLALRDARPAMMGYVTVTFERLSRIRSGSRLVSNTNTQETISPLTHISESTGLNESGTLAAVQTLGHTR